MPYIGKKPADIIATAVDTTTGNFSETLAVTGETTLATHLNMGDSDTIKLGDSAELQIYHTGSGNSIISETGGGDLYIDGTNLYLRNSTSAGENYFSAVSDGAVTLYHNNNSKLATKSDGVDITGELQSDSLDVDGNADISGNLNMSGAGNIDLSDGASVRFGASQDLTIRHTGTNSFIEDNGTGSLYIDASNFNIRAASHETYLTAVENGAVSLYYDNAVKLATTSTGIDVTGTVSADQVTLDGTGTSNFTSTATSPVQINGTSIPTLTVRNSTTPVELQMRATTGEGLVRTSTNHPLTFAVNASEKMRIDSSGNLLVGKTIADNTTVGVRIQPDGFASFARNGNFPLLLNRKNDSGIILDIRHDDTTVGSIQERFNNIQIGTGETNILFNNGSNEIAPSSSSGGVRDNTTDLGANNRRWKNVWVAGGVYLGGTGSANKLDDYEEGTFTPTLALSNATLASTGGSGRYTKIGRHVYVEGVVTRNSSSGGGASNVQIESLPFTALNANSIAVMGAGIIWIDEGGPSTNQGDSVGFAYIDRGTTQAYLVRATSSGAETSARYAIGSEFSTGRPIYFNFSYTTS